MMPPSNAAEAASIASDTIAPAPPVPPAHSIFEYLSTKNPKVSHRDAGKSLTSNLRFMVPMRLIPWHEFNFKTMEQIFERQLMAECTRPRLMHHIYPPPDPNRDLIEKSEDSTKWILKSWTIPMVNAALGAVVKSLNPVFWTAQGLVGPSETSIAPSGSSTGRTAARRQPDRQAKLRVSLVGKDRKPKSFIPDGGGLSFENLSALAAQKAEAGNPGTLKSADRLPKEIKPGTKWTSEPLAQGKIVDENGEWLEYMKWHSSSAPLRQIYTYCARARSRYGCIVTSKEVVVVRIQLEKDEQSSCDDSSSKLMDDLEESLQTHGLMEWKSIKWSEHMREGRIEDYKEITMNMALWIMHILAGNDCEIGIGYNPLMEEKIEKRSQNVLPSPVVVEPQQPKLRESRPRNSFQDSFSTTTDIATSFTSTASRKRRHDSPESGAESRRGRSRRRR
ncbi:hypothetical protein F5Y10DRAFT_250167 [Nemania abortiva]|nr:hypothetical protein F5Y10DRAFT_250167 [Nemania abortiva]